MGAVLDHLGQRLAELLAAGAEGRTISEAVDRQLRVLAHTSLDGYSIGELQSRFPTMELLLESVRARHSTELGARLAAAHTIERSFRQTASTGFRGTASAKRRNE